MRLALALVLLPLTAYAEPPEAKPSPWDAFAEARRGECVGPAGTLDAPLEFAAGGHKYRLEGSKLVQVDRKGADLKVGVISATKDDREETIAALQTLIKRMKLAKVDVIIANGDLGADEFQLEAVMNALADSEILVVAHAGNTESCGSFNRMADQIQRKKMSFINGNWVRRFELDGGTLLTLPGYYDKRFVHTSGAARYSTDDLAALRKLAEGAPKPVVLVSHGPPKMMGKKGIDVATDVGNVGDQDMTDLIKELQIPFGIFGHILEAGGRGTDLTGRAPAAPNTWQKALYVNAGTANPDPWGMLDGSTSYGMAVILELSKDRGKFHVEKLPKP